MTRRGRLSYRGVGVRFGSRWAVRAVDLTVPEGAIVAIVGPSGSGKSTLLRLAAGLLRPTEGEVRHGEGLVSDGVGYIAQQDALFPWQRLLDNAIAPLRYRGVPPAERAKLAHLYLDRVHFPSYSRTLYPSQLSGGMRQRAALAQVLARDPWLLLLDEPFAALDAQTRELLQAELQDLLLADRRTAVLVTHDLTEAITLADEVAVLSAGPAARIRTSYTIELPRPRKVGVVIATDEFAWLYRNLHRELAEEVRRAVPA